MKNQLALRFLFLSAFIEGAALMSLEILSSKIIAPYYGASLYVWATVIGVTMSGLATGYYLGGRFSEHKFNTMGRLITLFVISSFLLFTMPIVSSWILASTLDLEIRLGIFLSCSIFLLPPVVCFGMISPILIRMITQSEKRIGFSSGMVYTVSTSGGIVFTFITGFFLVSSIGVRNCMFVIGALLILPPLVHVILSLVRGSKKTVYEKK